MTTPAEPAHRDDEVALADPTARRTTIVIGARTRLGEAVLRRLADADDDLVLMARGPDDQAALAQSPAVGARTGSPTSGEPTATIVPIAAIDETLGRCAGPLRVLILAMGPSHATAPGVVPPLEKDMSDVTRDLRILDAALAGRPGTHVVLVSSILALAPKVDRRYYGGWKGVVEQSVRARTEAARGVLTVLHPGRLTTPEDKAAGRAARLATRYDRVAEAVTEAPATSAQRIVGHDSKIWLLARSIQFLRGSLFTSTSHRSRSGRSRRRPPR